MAARTFVDVRYDGPQRTGAAAPNDRRPATNGSRRDSRRPANGALRHPPSRPVSRVRTLLGRRVRLRGRRRRWLAAVSRLFVGATARPAKRPTAGPRQVCVGAHVNGLLRPPTRATWTRRRPGPRRRPRRRRRAWWRTRWCASRRSGCWTRCSRRCRRPPAGLGLNKGCGRQRARGTGVPRWIRHLYGALSSTVRQRTGPDPRAPPIAGCSSQPLQRSSRKPRRAVHRDLVRRSFRRSLSRRLTGGRRCQRHRFRPE
jgi:hypothetical protein